MSLNYTLISKKINLILANQCILILKKICYSQINYKNFLQNDMVVGFPKTIPGLEIIAQAKGLGCYKNFPLA